MRLRLRKFSSRKKKKKKKKGLGPLLAIWNSYNHQTYRLIEIQYKMRYLYSDLIFVIRFTIFLFRFTIILFWFPIFVSRFTIFVSQFTIFVSRFTLIVFQFTIFVSRFYIAHDILMLFLRSPNPEGPRQIYKCYNELFYVIIYSKFTQTTAAYFFLENALTH